MENAVVHLESLFEKAEADLDFVTRKLDTELDVKCAENGFDNVCFFIWKKARYNKNYFSSKFSSP